MKSKLLVREIDHVLGWVDEPKATDPQEYSNRIAALLKWMDYCGVESALIAIPKALYLQERAKLPSPTEVPLIPAIPPAESNSMRRKGNEAVALLKVFAKNLPEDSCSDIYYCLNASKGRRIPDDNIDFDHLFAFLLNGMIPALEPFDKPTILQILPSFGDWLEQVNVKRGYSKEELAARLLRLFGVDDVEIAKEPLTVLNAVPYFRREIQMRLPAIERFCNTSSLKSISSAFREALDRLTE